MAFAVGLGLVAASCQVQPPPPPTPVTTTATPTQVAEQWRPAVKVRWDSAATRARVDALGESGDCDGLMNAYDAATDAALKAYIYEWFIHSRLCHDAYYQE